MGIEQEVANEITFNEQTYGPLDAYRRSAIAVSILGKFDHVATAVADGLTPINVRGQVGSNYETLLSIAAGYNDGKIAREDVLAHVAVARATASAYLREQGFDAAIHATITQMAGLGRMLSGLRTVAEMSYQEAAQTVSVVGRD